MSFRGWIVLEYIASRSGLQMIVAWYPTNSGGDCPTPTLMNLTLVFGER